MGLLIKLFGKKDTGPYENITEEIKEVKESEEEEATPVVVEEPPVEVKPNIPPLDLMKVNYKASPNKSTRRGEVKYLVLHHTGPGSFNGIVNWLCNPQAKASAHYVLGANAQLTQLVNTGKEAWHAGRAKWEGVRIDNHCSIGIEICNIGRMDKGEDGFYYYEQGRQTKKYTGKIEPHAGTIVYPSGKILSGYYAPYPEKQIKKLVALSKALIDKYPAITRDNVITHYDIGYPEGRKNDPFGLDVEKIKDLIFG